MASVPKPFTLSINVGDTMNYKGQQYAITNVGAGVDNNAGVINYAVTLSNGTVLSVNANNCVVENPGTGAANTGVQVWKQTVNP